MFALSLTEEPQRPKLADASSSLAERAKQEVKNEKARHRRGEELHCSAV